MNNGMTVKRVSKSYESCERCGLSVINCICEILKKTKTQVQFWILSSLREFYRPSGTARLIQLINPQSTDVFLWERTIIPEELVKRISSLEYEVYLLFPAETEALEKRHVTYEALGHRVAFIIVDGTWKEARRIVRKSSYLNELPIVSINPEGDSQFNLRKGAGRGQFCTIEAAIEVLNLNGEVGNAGLFRDAFQLFLKAYQASASGHRLV